MTSKLQDSQCWVFILADYQYHVTWLITLPPQDAFFFWLPGHYSLRFSFYFNSCSFLVYPAGSSLSLWPLNSRKPKAQSWILELFIFFKSTFILLSCILSVNISNTLVLKLLSSDYISPMNSSYVSSCVLDTSIIFNAYLKLHIYKIELLIPPSLLETYFFQSLPVSVNGNSTLPTAQAPNLGVTLTFLFLFHPISIL